MREILFVESGILSLESRIKLKESGIPLTNGNEFYLHEIHISGFALKLALRRRVSATRKLPDTGIQFPLTKNQESLWGLWNPEFKIVQAVLTYSSDESQIQK